MRTLEKPLHTEKKIRKSLRHREKEIEKYPWLCLVNVLE